MSIVSWAMRRRFSGFMCSSVRMLCSRSASFTSSTRTSLDMAIRSFRKFSACSVFFEARLSFSILVTPSTSAAMFGPKLLDLLQRGGRVLDRVVKQRGRDGFVVELERRKDRGDFDGVGDIGVARGPLLLAMRLHGVNISAIEKRFVRLWIVALYFFDEIVLPHDWLRSRLWFNLHGLDSPSTT